MPLRMITVTPGRAADGSPSSAGGVDGTELARAFAGIRTELKIPQAFPPEVEEAARAAVASARMPATDLTDLPFFTLDRKSTRLNSSHPSISYAVFCLKKKTI